MAKGSHTEERMREARRRFLTSCGKFAVATPPVVTLLLSGSEQNYAMASSGFHNRHPNNGFGNGGLDGVPGHSHHSDVNR